MFDWLPIEAIGCRSSPRSLRPGQNADPVTVSVVSAVLLSSALLSSAEERFSYTNLCKEQGTSPSRARERESSQMASHFSCCISQAQRATDNARELLKLPDGSDCYAFKYKMEHVLKN